MSIMNSLFGGGNFPNQPTSSGTTVATSEFPKELAPFIKDILEKAQSMQQGASYQPYTGAQIAPFNTLEKDAMAGLEAQTRGLAGTDVANAAQYFTGAKSAIEGLGQQFTGDTVQQFMNPYQQAVTDQAKRKATEDYEAQQMTLAANASKNQPFGGSRQAITEGMAQGDYLDRLSNIQERGLAAGFTQGRAGFEAQKGRELQMANALMGMGATVPQQAYRDLGIRQQIGETQRSQDQMALDLGTKQFMEEREFPTRALQEYSATVRGFPFQPSTYQTTTNYQPSPGIGQQLVNLAGQGLGGYTAFTGQPMQDLFKAEGGITTLPTYYNQRGENRQRQISIYDLIDRSPEAQQFLADEEAAEEQQGLAEDALNMEYEIERRNTKSLGDKILDMLYTPQRMMKKVIGRAEGGLTGIPVYYNDSGDNNQIRIIENEDGSLSQYIAGDGTGGLQANTMMEPTQPLSEIDTRMINNAVSDNRDKENIGNFFSGLGYKLKYPFSKEYNQSLQNNSGAYDATTSNEEEVLQNNNNMNLNFNMQPNDSYLLNTEGQDISTLNTQGLESNTENLLDLLNTNNIIQESAIPFNDETNLDINNLNMQNVKEITDMNAETVDQPTMIDLNKSDIDALGMVEKNIANLKPTSRDDAYRNALEGIGYDERLKKVLDNYDYMSTPEYAAELEGKASERKALGQGLAMMKAFSSSDPTQGIVGNLSNQIGSFAENVTDSEMKYLQEMQSISNLGMEAPAQALDAIIATTDSAFSKLSERDVKRDTMEFDTYLRTNDLNFKKDTLGYEILKLLHNSNLTNDQLKAKAVEINNNTKFQQRSLENDLIKSILTYKGTLAKSKADLNKITRDAIQAGYINETQYNSIYTSVAAGLTGQQIIYKGGALLETVSGKALDEDTVIRVNQAMADVIKQVGNKKMLQSVTGAVVGEPAAELQARLINQYKVYFDSSTDGLPALTPQGQAYFTERMKEAGGDTDKFKYLAKIIRNARAAQTNTELDYDLRAKNEDGTTKKGEPIMLSSLIFKAVE